MTEITPPPDWSKDLHKAFRLWHRTASDENPLATLALYQQRAKGQSGPVRRLVNELLWEGLVELKARHPEYEELLRLRFLDEQPVLNVANRLNIGESAVYPRQRAALAALGELLWEQELQAQAAQTHLLAERLPPPTYLQLVGTEAPLQALERLITQPEMPWIVAIEGLGGMGKTSLADALMRRLIGHTRFEDIGWISSQREFFNLGGRIDEVARPVLTAAGLVEALSHQLMGELPTSDSLANETAIRRLQQRLRARPHLIVIDNLETVVDVEQLLPVLRQLINPTKFILTSRESRYEDAGLYHFPVPELAEADALALVRQEAHLRNIPHLRDSEDEVLRPIYETVGGNPLALRLVVGQSHIHNLPDILQELTTEKGAKAEVLYEYIYWQVWERLSESERLTLLAMPFASMRGGTLDWLIETSGLEAPVLRQALELLVRLNLIDVRGEPTARRYSIHNLTRSFLHERVAKWA